MPSSNAHPPYSEESEDEEFSDEKMSESEDEGDGNPTETERRAAMDNLVPSLEPAEYGQMPASYHANSQRVAPTMETGVVEDSERKVTEKAPQDDSPMRPIRQPILPRDKYDGVDSDDDTDDDDGPEQDDESDEDQPQVMGEIEVDMGQEEEEFLEFSRQALGISDEQWEEIVRDRKGRGGMSCLIRYASFAITHTFYSIRALERCEPASSIDQTCKGSECPLQTCTKSIPRVRTSPKCQSEPRFV